MKEWALTVREIDELLEHLYGRLKGKKEGLSMTESAVILLALLKRSAEKVYFIHVSRFSPIIVDTLISRAYISFGYEGLESLMIVSDDIPMISGDYTIEGADENISWIRSRLDSVREVLNGSGSGAVPEGSHFEEKPPVKTGFFREKLSATASLPFVSIYKTGGALMTTGRLVSLRAELRITGEWSARKKYNPVVSFEHIAADPDSPFERQIHEAIKAAENVSRRALQVGGISRIPREYEISIPEFASITSSSLGIMTGGSAGLAFSVMLVSLLAGLDLSRKRVLIRPGTAFTGMVDENGKVLPVENSLMGEKVRSVFFSTSERFIVPRDNFDAAAEVLEILSAEYPKRRLELIPAGDVGEIIGDESIVELQKVPAGKPLLQRLFHWRKHLVAGASALVAAYAFFSILPAYTDKKVAAASLQNSFLIMTNKAGHELKRHDCGFQVINPKSQGCARILISDFNRDGADEVTCVLAESRSSKSSSSKRNRVHALVFDSKGMLQKQYTYDTSEIVRSCGKGLESDAGLRMMRSTSIYMNEKGEACLYVCTNHMNYPPSCLIRFSLTSEGVQVFLHRGALSDIVITDFDRDGREDIVTSGYNLDLGSPVMIILDPDNINGSSPPGSSYGADGQYADVAKYYIRFANSDHFLPQISKILPFITEILEKDSGLTCTVKSAGDDISYLFSEGPRCRRGTIIYTIRRGRTKPDSIAAVEFEGKEELEKTLVDGIRYWDGENWVREVVPNRNYFKATAAVSGGQGGAKY